MTTVFGHKSRNKGVKRDDSTAATTTISLLHRLSLSQPLSRPVCTNGSTLSLLVVVYCLHFT